MKPWKVSDIENAKYVGLLEFEGKPEEFHNFEILLTVDKLVFGSFCNVGFLESGYMELENELHVELGELLQELEVYYNDGVRYTNRIVCNSRM